MSCYFVVIAILVVLLLVEVTFVWVVTLFVNLLLLFKSYCYSVVTLLLLYSVIFGLLLWLKLLCVGYFGVFWLLKLLFGCYLIVYIGVLQKCFVVCLYWGVTKVFCCSHWSYKSVLLFSLKLQSVLLLFEKVIYYLVVIWLFILGCYKSVGGYSYYKS